MITCSPAAFKLFFNAIVAFYCTAMAVKKDYVLDMLMFEQTELEAIAESMEARIEATQCLTALLESMTC
jgi:hypothetical protein